MYTIVISTRKSKKKELNFFWSKKKISNNVKIRKNNKIISTNGLSWNSADYETQLTKLRHELFNRNY